MTVPIPKNLDNQKFWNTQNTLYEALADPEMRVGGYACVWDKRFHCGPQSGPVTEIRQDGFAVGEKFIPYSQLNGLSFSREVPGWNFENRDDLHAVEKGRVKISSGKIVIVDPQVTCEHTINLGQGFGRERSIFEVGEVAFERLHYGRDCRKLPMIEGRKAVYLDSSGGDGTYPVYKRTNGLEILISNNVPKNKNVSTVYVDTGMIIVSDAKNLSLLPTFAGLFDKIAVIFEVANGIYEITQNDETLPGKDPYEERKYRVKLEKTK